MGKPAEALPLYRAHALAIGCDPYMVGARSARGIEGGQGRVAEL